MTPADLALCALALLSDLDDPSHQAEALTQACDSRECIVTLAVLWRMESRFTLYPSTRHAFGPVQVLAVKGLTPDARTMRDDPVAGLRAGWVVWQAKAKRLRTTNVETIARAYNGAKRKLSYGRKAARLISRVEKECRE